MKQLPPLSKVLFKNHFNNEHLPPLSMVLYKKKLVIVKQLPPLTKVLYKNPCHNEATTSIIKGFV